MRAWQLAAGATSIDDLHLVERDQPAPGPGQVAIRVHACSLNYRDQAVVLGRYLGGPVPNPTIPLSDGAGEVIAVGAGVTQFKPGDRVAGTFFQSWDDGPPNPAAGLALGAAGADGMLAEVVVLPEQGVVPIAKSLSYAEAACLPCAGVTAWNALFEGPRPVKPGERVLLLGTGGVSILALQLAKAAGCEVIITSSSDAKLERAKVLGADHLINYREIDDWGQHVSTTMGGVDKVVEVGGAGTVQQSMAALRHNGEVALIGVLNPVGGPNPSGLMFVGGTLRGIFVGSRGMARRLAAAIDVNGIKPVIGARYAFEDAKAAFAHGSGSEHFSKVVIDVR
ncbi:MULTISPECIES: zinc-dependent alcohol dehydrogenase family protein [unclassified Sphingobium]|uniref:zinc-dependent alcohol dehydrogenase family protein n=1 Tax=unclassified Sphingobium TaxID=2611147 RepID=UPI002225574A|nr:MULTISPECIES: NAD(P)-dependent alcohol dehydrogenase [unclassified Sphingobium]MCW2394520.1 NADPH:quinone reductase-like Zn-dependent oxidoreductase [Sphingobium sp. B8D3B]MCW2418034.1 NADPH:quinone reductase-like Zn-dependent oxidoreductase [Sphingobium sp. B8D3C]